MSLRLFSALELPSELQQQLARLQASLRAQVPPRLVRWVRPEGIHLTLKFYGDFPAERLPQMQAGLARAATVQGPMEIAIEGVGVFPNAARPTVVWAGVGGELALLQRLAAAVEQEALALGFKPENREYRPHLTLGRVNDGAGANDIQRLMAALDAARAAKLGRFRPEHLSLMNSELSPGGSVYSQLFTAPLGAANESSSLSQSEMGKGRTIAS